MIKYSRPDKAVLRHILPSDDYKIGVPVNVFYDIEFEFFVGSDIRDRIAIHIWNEIISHKLK